MTSAEYFRPAGSMPLLVGQGTWKAEHVAAHRMAD